MFLRRVGAIIRGWNINPKIEGNSQAENRSQHFLLRKGVINIFSAVLEYTFLSQSFCHNCFWVYPGYQSIFIVLWPSSSPLKKVWHPGYSEYNLKMFIWNYTLATFFSKDTSFVLMQYKHGCTASVTFQSYTLFTTTSPKSLTTHLRHFATWNM